MSSKVAFNLNLLLIVLLLLSAYNYARNAQSEASMEQSLFTNDDSNNEDGNKEEVVLTIWSPKPMLEYEIQSFEEANPHIRIELTSLHEEPRITERYLNALAEGTAPDILVLSQTMLGSMNSVDLIADLSLSPLNFEKYRETMGEYLWRIHQSLDGNRTIALPYEAYPYVLYYRQDILKENGYPHEPEQLTEWLSEPTHLLELVAALKENNQWFMQWETDLLSTINFGQYIFSKDIEYQRDSEFYRQLIDTTFKSKDYAANISIWSPLGQEMLRNNQFVMTIMPSYGENNLVEWAPDQTGKWRVTRLPIKMEAIDMNAGSSLAITEDSEHKAEAEKFLEHILSTSTVFNWFASSPEHAFLGGQRSGLLYWNVLKESSLKTVPTPLDARMFDVWYNSIEQARRGQYSVDDTLQAAAQDVLDNTSVAQEQLRQYLQKSSQ